MRCVLLLILLLLVYLTAPALCQDNSIVVWQHFPYDSSVLASYGGQGPSATPVLTGPAISNTTRRFGTGSAFNSAPSRKGYVVISYTRTASWSLSFWLFLAANISSNAGRIFVPDPNTQQPDFDFFVAQGDVLMLYYDNMLVSERVLTLPLLAWTHVVVTGTDGGGGTSVSTQPYINGTAVDGTINLPSQAPTGAKNYNALLDGGLYVDELWTLNGALSASQVRQLYTSNTFSQ